MWSDRPHQAHEPSAEPDTDDTEIPKGLVALVLGAGLALATVVVFVFATAWLSGILTGALPAPVPLLLATPQALIALPSHLGDPAAAWPADIAPSLGGPVAFLVAFVLLAALAAASVRRVWPFVRWLRRRRTPGETDWATTWDLRRLVVHRSLLARLRGRAPHNGVILGRTRERPRRLLAVENQESHTLIIAGTRSGKTAGLCIPALLTFPGAVIATSVKNDLIDRTVARRRQLGRVHVFDPVETTGYESAGWTPLATSGTWEGAQRTAASLIEAGTHGQGSGGNMQFFTRMAQQTLPCLLYAASLSGGSMRDVVRWLNTLTDDATAAQVSLLLKRSGTPAAAESWMGFCTREPKLRGDIAATVAAALVAYEDEKVQRSADRCDIRPEEFFDGGANTLYVVAPMAEQSRLEPIFVSLMQEMLIWVTQQPRPLGTPLLCVLDEAANIAALPLLPELLSTIGGQRVQILTAWQDLSQIASRYDTKKHTILNNSRAKLVLAGVTDPETIRYFTDITGETSDAAVSVAHAAEGGGAQTKTVSSQRRNLLTPAVIREQRTGEGILVYGHLRPMRIKLRMYFKDRALKAMAAGGRAPAPLGALGRLIGLGSADADTPAPAPVDTPHWVDEPGRGPAVRPGIGWADAAPTTEPASGWSAQAPSPAHPMGAPPAPAAPWPTSPATRPAPAAPAAPWAESAASPPRVPAAPWDTAPAPPVAPAAPWDRPAPAPAPVTPVAPAAPWDSPAPMAPAPGVVSPAAPRPTPPPTPAPAPAPRAPWAAPATDAPPPPATPDTSSGADALDAARPVRPRAAWLELDGGTPSLPPAPARAPEPVIRAEAAAVPAPPTEGDQESRRRRRSGT